MEALRSKYLERFQGNSRTSTGLQTCMRTHLGASIRDSIVLLDTTMTSTDEDWSVSSIGVHAAQDLDDSWPASAVDAQAIHESDEPLPGLDFADLFKMGSISMQRGYAL